MGQPRPTGGFAPAVLAIAEARVDERPAAGEVRHRPLRGADRHQRRAADGPAREQEGRGQARGAGDWGSFINAIKTVRTARRDIRQGSLSGAISTRSTPTTRPKSMEPAKAGRGKNRGPRNGDGFS